MACNKKPLSREGAIAALAIIRSQRNNRKTEKKPCRTYYCKGCEAWHLTSQTKKEFYNHQHQNRNK